MTDEQYLERINALEDTLKAAHAETKALLSYAIGERVEAKTDALRKKEFRRDSVRLDQVNAALKTATARMGQIE